jgi:hypothetical protein
MANTIIQIKRSQNTALPSSLNYGELAISFQSGKLAVGNSTGVPIVVGGNTYVQTIDSATSSNTYSTLVKRDASGNFSASAITAALYGNANTATTWQTARNLTLTGDATANLASVSGAADVSAAITLTTVNSNVGTYGGASVVPSITVDAKGRITSISNNAISTGFTIAGNTGSAAFSGGSTLQFLATDGLSAAVSTNTVTITHDSSFIRTTGGQTINNGLTIGSGGLSITGDLVVMGNTTFTGNSEIINTTSLQIQDPLIYLASNNRTSDAISIGFVGTYSNGTANLATGLYRAPASNNYYLFTNVRDDLSNTNVITPSANGFILANLNSNLTGGAVYGLSRAIAVSDGGIGTTSLTAGQILVGNGTGAVQTIANVTAVNSTLSTNQTVSNITTDNWGRVTGFTTQNIGNLTLSQGGTNNNTFTAGSMIVANGTSLISLANTGTAGTYGSASQIPVITTDGYGRVSGVTNTNIAISASQITSGVLPYNYGGTGTSAAPTAGGVVYGNGTAHLVTSAGTTGQALVSQGSASPSFGTLDLRGGGLGITTATANSVIYYSGAGNSMSYTNGPTDGQVLQFATATGVSFGGLDGGSF